MNSYEKPTITLLHHTPIEIVDIAIGTCWDKQKEGCDLERMERVVNKFKHQSVTEHCSFNFYIKGCSRSLLQELARHRKASPSVKSTRYTLKELKELEDIIILGMHGEQIIDVATYDRARKYLVFTEVLSVDNKSIIALHNLQQEIKSGTSNDKAKYCIPEAYKTELTWTINIRSLKNFISLRTNVSALWEIRHLAYNLYLSLPPEFKFLFKEDVYVGKEDDAVYNIYKEALNG